MPKFRVSGVFRRDFVVEVEAENEDDACDLVGQFSLNDFDATSYVETTLDDCIEVDENGEELPLCASDDCGNQVRQGYTMCKSCAPDLDSEGNEIHE